MPSDSEDHDDGPSKSLFLPYFSKNLPKAIRERDIAIIQQRQRDREMHPNDKNREPTPMAAYEAMASAEEYGSTIKRPAPYNDQLTNIENQLELIPLAEFGDNVYTNLRPLWHPPGARGIFGGTIIAMSLAAAIKTVPTTFTIHSMHCYFVLAGDSRTPVIYYVEHVREGRSFATRTVQARQRGAVIFTTTCSFQRPANPEAPVLNHAERHPEGVKQPEDCSDGEAEARELLKNGIISQEVFNHGADRRRNDPFERRPVEVYNDDSTDMYTKRVRSWVRAKGNMRVPIGGAAHLEALAYVSDSWFIGTILRAHKVRDVGMMVSLDHTIYFHKPFRADDWMLMESDTPWTGDQRGLVHQRILDRKGCLIATCFQEGVVRLRDSKNSKI